MNENDLHDLRLLAQSQSSVVRSKCIDQLKIYLKTNPDNQEALFLLASCHDFLGQEDLAEPLYSAVFESGFDLLPPDAKPRLFVQYGSTLRNNKRFDKAISVFLNGIQLFPNYHPLRIFAALTYHDLEKFEECSKILLASYLLKTDEQFDIYQKSIEFYLSEKNLKI